MLILHLLLPFPSSALVIAPFQACWAIPLFTVNACWQLFLFCLPRCSGSPLPLCLVHAGCCPMVQLCPWPLHPAMPNSDLPLPSVKAPAFVNACNTHIKSAWWYLRTSAFAKPGREKAELGSPSPTLCGFGGTIGVTSWEVTPRRNILQFLMGMKTNCNLQLNLFSSKSCLLCWIAAIILEI